MSLIQARNVLKAFRQSNIVDSMQRLAEEFFSSCNYRIWQAQFASLKRCQLNAVKAGLELMNSVHILKEIKNPFE